MKVTVVCENSVAVTLPRGLIGEHGLSFLIEGDDTSLFDTGQGMAILHNMALMGKDLNALARVILSHGHYDHVGGLAAVLEKKEGKTPVYLNPEAFVPKIGRGKIGDKIIEMALGFPLPREEMEKMGAEFRFVTGFEKVTDSITTISNIERPADWKGFDSRLQIRKDGETAGDPFNDDLSLLMETESGPVVLLGCAHAGVVEILNDLSAKSGYNEFYAVLGGTHLGAAPDEYIKKAIDSLKAYRVQVVGTSHCTGFAGAARISAAFGQNFKQASVGSVFEF